MSAHLVLLGDSVFDNGPYVPPEESVSEELARLLYDEARITLLARDGAVVRDVYNQLRKLPEESTHLFLSIGGNDAMGHWSVLEESAGRVRDGLERMGVVVAAFAEAYERLLDTILETELPLTLCTIYEGSFTAFADQTGVNAAVAMFDSAIFRCAAVRKLPIIELRDVCTSADHFTQVIEPSSAGSRAIAYALAKAYAASTR